MNHNHNLKTRVVSESIKRSQYDVDKKGELTDKEWKDFVDKGNIILSRLLKNTNKVLLVCRCRNCAYALFRHKGVYSLR